MIEARSIIESQGRPESYVNNIEAKDAQLQVLNAIVKEGISVLNGNRDIRDFGKLIHETWQVKRELSAVVSNASVDEIYHQAGGISLPDCAKLSTDPLFF